MLQFLSTVNRGDKLQLDLVNGRIVSGEFNHYSFDDVTNNQYIIIDCDCPRIKEGTGTGEYNPIAPDLDAPPHQVQICFNLSQVSFITKDRNNS